MEPLSVLHLQIWDSVHFYLIHLFEIGLRDRSQIDLKNNDEQKYDNDKWIAIDHEMRQTEIVIKHFWSVKSRKE